MVESSYMDIYPNFYPDDQVEILRPTKYGQWTDEMEKYADAILEGEK